MKCTSRVVYSTRWTDEAADKTDIDPRFIHRLAQDHDEKREPRALALKERKSVYTWLKTEAR